MKKLLAPIAVALCLHCGDELKTGGPTLPVPTCPQDLPAACPSSVPSYATDVVPILTEHCTKSCHAAGGTASDRLLTDYNHVFMLRGAVLDQVFACRMPPSPTALPDEQRALILAWLVCHAPDN